MLFAFFLASTANFAAVSSLWPRPIQAPSNAVRVAVRGLDRIAVHRSCRAQQPDIVEGTVEEDRRSA